MWPAGIPCGRQGVVWLAVYGVASGGVVWPAGCSVAGGV